MDEEDQTCKASDYNNPVHAHVFVLECRNVTPMNKLFLFYFFNKHSRSHMNVSTLVENGRSLWVVSDVTSLKDHVTGP